MAIFNSVAALVGGSGPLHGAAAAMIINQHPLLPTLRLGNLARQSRGLAGQCSGVRPFVPGDAAGARKGHGHVHGQVQRPARKNGRASKLPPELCGINQEIAFQAMISPEAKATHIKFWAVDAVLKYPASGIMGLVVRLEERHLSAVYQPWVAEALVESAC
ncbi:hypothetical protein J3F83DRAFT_254348 [Trichoderma novae-zelandiae]